MVPCWRWGSPQRNPQGKEGNVLDLSSSEASGTGWLNTMGGQNPNFPRVLELLAELCFTACHDIIALWFSKKI